MSHALTRQLATVDIYCSMMTPEKKCVTEWHALAERPPNKERLKIGLNAYPLILVSMLDKKGTLHPAPLA